MFFLKISTFLSSIRLKRSQHIASYVLRIGVSLNFYFVIHFNTSVTFLWCILEIL